MKLQTKLNLRRAAMRMRRVQTDSELGVLIDALFEDDAARAGAIAESTGGRVTFEPEAPTTGPMIAWAIRRVKDRVEYLNSTEYEYVPGNNSGDYATFAHGDRFVFKQSPIQHHDDTEGLRFFDDQGYQIHEIRFALTTLMLALRASPRTLCNEYCSIPRSASPRYQALLRQVAKPWLEQFGPNLDITPATQVGSMIHRDVQLYLSFEDAADRMNPDTATGEDLDRIARLL